MDWKKVAGNYQNWEIDTAAILPSDAESRFGAPERLFHSEDLTVWFSRRRESMPYFFRNCDADELHLISRGEMTYETDLGSLSVGARDFLLIPKGITYRVVMESPQDTLRLIYESAPEIFLAPTSMVDHIYGKGRPAVSPDRLERPKLLTTAEPEGRFEVRIKYHGAFADFLGEMSSIVYDRYPLDVEVIDGEQPVYKFSAADIEKLGTTPVCFMAAAYLDNKSNLAWTLHLSGGGVGNAPVHRDADADELRYSGSGPMTGNFLFTPQGVDHGGGRGYTKKERNRAAGPYDVGDSISIYTVKALKGTALAYRFAKPYPA
jgi:homogentisate 1,2-dioxygenase